MRVFDDRMKQLCLHPTKPPGQFSTLPEHIASEKINAVERGIDWLLGRTRTIGPKTNAWTLGCVSARGVQAVRASCTACCSFPTNIPAMEIEASLRTAHANQCYRLQSLRKLIRAPAAKQQQFEFLEEHPLIRNLASTEVLFV